MAVLEPGVPTAMFTRLNAEGALRGRIALTELADAIKKQARINANNGNHVLGTKTPATPGTGPARISRTLSGGIDRSNVTRQPFGWLCQVGTVVGLRPTYSNKNSSKYGYILEVTGCRDGSKYPFLYPAFTYGANTMAKIIFDAKYGTSGWTRVI